MMTDHKPAPPTKDDIAVEQKLRSVTKEAEALNRLVQANLSVSDDEIDTEIKEHSARKRQQ